MTREPGRKNRESGYQAEGQILLTCIVLLAVLVIGPWALRIAVVALAAGFVLFGVLLGGSLDFRPGDRVLVRRGPYAGRTGRVADPPLASFRLRVRIEVPTGEPVIECEQSDARRFWRDVVRRRQRGARH